MDDSDDVDLMMEFRDGRWDDWISFLDQEEGRLEKWKQFMKDEYGKVY